MRRVWGGVWSRRAHWQLLIRREGERCQHETGMRVRTKTTAASFHLGCPGQSKRIITTKAELVEKFQKTGLQEIAIKCFFEEKSRYSHVFGKAGRKTSCKQTIWCLSWFWPPLIPLAGTQYPQEQPQNPDSSQRQREAKVSQLPPFQQIPKFQELQRGHDNTGNKTSTAGVPPPHPPPPPHTHRRLFHSSLLSRGCFYFAVCHSSSILIYLKIKKAGLCINAEWMYDAVWGNFMLHTFNQTFKHKHTVIFTPVLSSLTTKMSLQWLRLQQLHLEWHEQTTSFHISWWTFLWFCKECSFRSLRFINLWISYVL